MTPQTNTQLDSESLWRILDVTRQLSAPVDLDELLVEVIDAARHVLSADRGTVFLYDAETKELYARVATGAKEIRFPADRGIAGEAAQTRQVLNIPDCYADERFNQEIDRKTGYRTRCLLTVPLVGVDDELVGVMQMLNKSEGVFDEHDERIATVLAAQCGVALQRVRLIESHVEAQRMQRDLALARDIQQRVLPRKMPEFEGYDIAGWSRPADETGGDIFDAIRLSDTSALLSLCDATGHGIGPALSVTQVRSMVRIGARLNANLDDIFKQVNDQLVEDLAENRFVTAFFGILDTTKHEIHYHAGGQGPMLHLHAADGTTSMLEASTIPMGIAKGMPVVAPPPIQMAPGDIMGLISDGIFEQVNEANKQYTADATATFLHANRDMPMAELIPALIDEVERFSHGVVQGDDMTVVLVKRL